ncbi:MAG TPA: hypothetical protein GXX55_11315 [Firmicutes bacterium]|nr:hypothetical protein [Bacillota bacterium]
MFRTRSCACRHRPSSVVAAATHLARALLPVPSASGHRGRPSPAGVGTVIVAALLGMVEGIGHAASANPFPFIVAITADFPAVSPEPVFPRSPTDAFFAEDWVRTPWAYPRKPRVLHREGLGLLVDPRGYVLTTQHLVGFFGDQQRITVRISSSTGRAGTPEGVYSARLMAVDPLHDLALLALETRPAAGAAGSPAVPEAASILPALDLWEAAPTEPPPDTNWPVKVLVPLPGGRIDSATLQELPALVTSHLPAAGPPSPDRSNSSREPLLLFDPILEELRPSGGLIPLRLAPASSGQPATDLPGFLPPGAPVLHEDGRLFGLATGLLPPDRNPGLTFVASLQAGRELLEGFLEQTRRTGTGT